MGEPIYPSLYQLNTRVWLTELSRQLGRPTALDDIPDSALDRLAQMGFDWIWLLSVWSTGPAGRTISRESREWRHEFQDTLPDLCDADIGGSGFAITGYTVDPPWAATPPSPACARACRFLKHRSKIRCFIAVGLKPPIIKTLSFESIN